MTDDKRISPYAGLERDLRFGPFALRQHGEALYRDGKLVRLGSRARSILALLIRNAGQVVSKREIMEAVWPETTVVEANLTVHNRAATASEALDRVRLDAAQEVVMANAKLRTSLAGVRATKSLLNASQTTYDAALAAFRDGVGSSTDVLAAERQLLEARNVAADAHSAALSAAATLAFACGSLGKPLQ